MSFRRVLLAVSALSICYVPASYGTNAMDEIYENLQRCSPELISQQGSIAVAKGALEITQAKRSPTFSLAASGKIFASKDNTINQGRDESDVTAKASYTLYSFGKQETNEALSANEVASEELALTAQTQKTLEELLLKQTRIRQLMRDIERTNEVLIGQQDLLDRVERRFSVEMSSEADRNSVFSKVWQNRNKVRDNELELALLRSDLSVLACTDFLRSLTLNSIPSFTSELSIFSLDFRNADLRQLSSKISAKKSEIEAAKVSLMPDLDLEGSIPINDDADTDSSIGLALNVEYANLGRAQSARMESLSAEVRALEQQLVVESSRRLEELNRLNEQIQTLSKTVIPNQTVSLEATEKKLQSKERLFAAGRVPLFELLSAYDEVLSAQLELSQFNADLETAIVKRSKALDFVHR